MVTYVSLKISTNTFIVPGNSRCSMWYICLLSNLVSQPHKASPRDQKNSLSSWFMLGIKTWPRNWTLRRKTFGPEVGGICILTQADPPTPRGLVAEPGVDIGTQNSHFKWTTSTLKDQKMWGVCSGFIEWGGESRVRDLFLLCEVRVNYSTLSFNLSYFFLLTGFTTYSLGGHPSAFPSPLPPCLPLWLWTDLHKLSPLSVFLGWDSFTQRHTILTL